MKAQYLVYGLISIAIIGGLAWYISISPKLPPTTLAGHIEESPPAHIVAMSIPENIQKHMLEHADGVGKPGIVIQYNCEKYQCGAELISSLTAIVEQYPDTVYLAPNDYDGKIILTKVGKIKVLDDFDEAAIREFIER